MTPPSATAATGPQPSSSAAATPGAALSTRSTQPAGACGAGWPTSSSAVYSRPSVNSSRITPISAPAEMNSSLVASGRMPPVPKASPASRYSGIGRDADPERPARPACRDPRMTAPSSIRRIATCTRALPVGEDLGDGRGALGGADHDDDVAGVEARSPGAGLANTCPPRTTATIEAPVRVRACVSPSGRPSYGEPAGSASARLTSPSTCRCSSARRSTIRAAPSSSASALASSSFSVTAARAVGVGGIVYDQVAPARAVRDDPDPPSDRAS